MNIRGYLIDFKGYKLERGFWEGERDLREGKAGDGVKGVMEGGGINQLIYVLTVMM